MTTRNPASRRRRLCLMATAALAATLSAWRPLTAQTQGPTGPPYLPRLRLIGEQRLAHRQPFQDTAVGGLSGVDYLPATGQWVLLSDDRSELAPARFYTARMALDAHGLATPELSSVTLLRRPDGAPFDRREADPEAIRLHPGTGTLLWTSEGDVRTGLPPFVREMRADGTHLREFTLPDSLRPSAQSGQGPRDNLTLESLALTPDGRHVWAAMEAPLTQDGPVPAVGQPGGVCRFVQWDFASGQPVREITYRPDGIPQATVPAGGYADNGVSEILMRDARRMWVLERAYMQGVGNSLRLYEIDVDGPPLVKHLVLDFASLGLPRLDNTEGMCWGPTLPARDGSAPRRTLVCVSDDNFNRGQITQFLAFEVIE